MFAYFKSTVIFSYEQCSYNIHLVRVSHCGISSLRMQQTATYDLLTYFSHTGNLIHWVCFLYWKSYLQATISFLHLKLAIFPHSVLHCTKEISKIPYYIAGALDHDDIRRKNFSNPMCLLSAHPPYRTKYLS
jgi:hypothetical protein